MASLIGKWQCCPELTTGYEDFMTALGIPKDKRKGQDSTFTLELSRDADTWTVEVDNPDHKELCQKLSLKNGEDLEFTGAFGESLVAILQDEIGTLTWDVTSKKTEERKWNAQLKEEGLYMTFKTTVRGKDLIMKLKRM